MPDRNGDPEVHDVWARWEQVDRLFDAALDLSPIERTRFLVQACGRDLELRRTVEELLEITANAGDTLTAPGAAIMRAAWGDDVALPESPPPLESGQRVGPYRIVAELGHGGMATVYEAERADGSFQHRVALKVLRRGIDTDDVVQRFLAERQILSGLTHPNIARLLDGGATDEGRPFLVMDRVEGEPITDYADHVALPIRERLKLFLQVVDAVHYAHQRLVVHRDLKPSNILVTTDGDAKLLDFGIAKLLGTDADDTFKTRVGMRPLTPEYASPEQLRGDAITTASDIYQLGVLLNMLLAGERPDARAGVRPPSAAIARESIAAQRATTPERLRRMLRGDLDTIALKALRAEPDQRYDSAHALAADVRRHLDDLPIAARPASARYRFGKFLERNRWFAPAAVVALVILTGFGVTRVRHQRQLEHERNAARAQAERAEQIKGFMTGLFGSADPWTPADPERGRAITVVEALRVGAERARVELADRPIMRADLLSAIASVYESLDQREPALSLLDEVLELRRQHETTPTPEYLEDLGRHAAMLHGQRDSARVQYELLLKLEKDLHGPDHPRVAGALLGYSNLASALGDFQQALDMRLEAIRILRKAGPDERKRLGDGLAFIADSYRELQRPGEAEAAAREALEIHRELFGDEHPSSATARVHLAQVNHARGHLDEAISLYREALPVLERELGAEHFITVNSWNNLGIVLMEAEDFAGAEGVHRRILAQRRALAGGSDDNTEIAGSLQNLAVTLIRQGHLSEAEALSRRAHEIYLKVLPAGHYLQAIPLLSVAEIQLMGANGIGAERNARHAVDILRAALPAGHFATAAAECRLAAAISQQARHAEAEPLMTAAFESLARNEQAPERHVHDCAEAMAALQRATGRTVQN
jgi:serine/threonine-protein kinase